MNRWKENKKSSGQKGSVFTVLLAGIAMAGILSVATYNILTGPVATMAKSNLHTRAMNDMTAITRIVMQYSATLASGGDCDADGYVEPVEYVAPGASDRNIPTNIGAPTADPWGTKYKYCPFDLGTTGNAACNRDAVPGTQMFTGSTTPTAGNENTRYVFAVISGGPDRIHQTTCANYVNGTTATVSPGGDDIVQTYTYEQALAAAPEYWKINTANPAVADTAKTVVEVSDTGGTAKASFAAASGLGSFNNLTTSGLLTATGGVQAGNQTQSTTCAGANDKGLIRYNDGGATPLATPTISGSVTNANLDNANDVAVSGNYAYVVGRGAGNRLTVVEVTTPASPTLRGNVSNANLGDARGVAVSGSFAYVAAAGASRLTVVDVSNVNAPVVRGSVTNAMLAGAGDVVVSGSFAYVATPSQNGIAVVDVSNPDAPVVRGTLAHANMAGAENLALSGSTLYVSAATAARLTVVDVSNPDAPTMRGSVATGLAGPQAIEVAGIYAYIVSETGDGLVVMDVSNPAAPVARGSVTSAVNLDGAAGLAVSGNYAYVSSSGGDKMTLVDISNPDAPLITVPVADPSLDLAWRITISGNYAYIASRSADSLTVLKVKDVIGAGSCALSGNTIAQVQTAPLQKKIGNDAAVSAAFPGTPAAGNTIVAVLSGRHDASVTTFHNLNAGHVSDSAGNTYVLVKKADLSTHDSVYIFAAYNVATAGGTFNVTIDPPADASGSYRYNWMAMEFSGLAASSAADQTGEIVVNKASASTSTTVTTSNPVIQANEIAVAVWQGGVGSAATSLTNAPNWTEAAIDTDGSGDGTPSTSVLYGNTYTLSAISASWNHNASGGGWSENYGAAIATFKGLSATPPSAAHVSASTPKETGAGVDSDNAVFANLPQLGDTIIVTVAGYTAGSAFDLSAGNVTDSQGGSYAEAKASTALAGNQRAYIFYKTLTAAPAAPFSVTINPTGASSNVTWGAIAVSGLAVSSPVDASGAATSASAVSTPVSTTGATTQASEFAVSVIADNSANCPVNYGVSGGWTAFFVENAGCSALGGAAAYTFLSATGVVSNTWTHASSTGETAAIATFKTDDCTGSVGPRIQVCNGATWLDVQGGGSSSSSSIPEFWADIAGGPPAPGIYYNAGNVMIGTDTNIAGQLFNVTGDGTRYIAGLYSYSGSNAPEVVFKRSRGTEALPGAVANADTLGTLGFYARIGGAWVYTGGMTGFVNGVPAGNIIPANLGFANYDGSTLISSAGFAMNTGANRTQPILALGTSSFNTAYLIQSVASDNGMDLISSSDEPEIVFQRERGSQAAPAAVTNGDYIGRISFQGYDSNSWATWLPGISALAYNTVTTSSIPTQLNLYPGLQAGADNPLTRGLAFDSAYRTRWLYGNGAMSQKFQMAGTIAVTDDVSPDTIPVNLTMPAGGFLVMHGGKGATKGGYRDGAWTLNEADLGVASFAYGGDGSVGYSSPTTSALVQSMKQDANHITTTGNTFASAVIPGNAVLVFVQVYQGTGGGSDAMPNGSVTDNFGNTYTQLLAGADRPPGIRDYVFLAQNVTSGSGSFTISLDPPVGLDQQVTWIAVEVAGLLTNPLDRSATTTAAAGSTSSPLATAATTQANEIAFSFLGWAGSFGVANNLAVGSGWTLIDYFDNTATSNGLSVGLAYKTQESLTAVSHTWTHVAVSTGTSSEIVTLKFANAAVPVPSTLLVGHYKDDDTADTLTPGPYIYTDQFTAAASGTAYAAVLSVVNGNGLPVRVGVYDASNNLLGSGARAILPSGSGLYDIPLSAPISITAGQNYRLAIQSDGAIGIETDVGVGTEAHCYMTRSYASDLPATFTCDATDNGGTLNVFLRTTSGTGIGPRATANTSFAFGKDTLASGSPSVAMGYEAEATAANAIAMGYRAKVAGVESIALGGDNHNINGVGSIAIGGGGLSGINVVQNAARNGLALDEGASSVSFANPPAAGNSIIVTVAGQNTASVGFFKGTVTDNKGNAYSLVTQSSSGGVSDRQSLIFGSYNIPAPGVGAFTITFTPDNAGSNATHAALGAIEVSGLAASPLDRIANRFATPSTTPAMAGTQSAISTAGAAQENELVVAAYVMCPDAMVANCNVVNTTGTSIFNYNNCNHAYKTQASAVYAAKSGAGNASMSWTRVAASACHEGIALATFKGATAAPLGSVIDADRSIAFGGPILMSAAADYSVGINLSNAPVSMTQASTFAVMGGKVGIGTVTPCSAGGSPVACVLGNVGDAGLTTGTAWTNTSDIRLKDVRGPYEKGLKEILGLKPVRFEYKKDNPRGNPSGHEYVGLIAQDVLPLFPQAVNLGTDGYYNLSMHPINVAVVNAVRELAAAKDGMNETQEAAQKENVKLNRDLGRLDGDLARLENFASGKEGSLWPLGVLGIAIPGLLLAFSFKRRRQP